MIQSFRREMSGLTMQPDKTDSERTVHFLCSQVRRSWGGILVWACPSVRRSHFAYGQELLEIGCGISLKNKRTRIFSSPVPKAHWWAYRIGRPPSSVVHTFKHLLRNHLANQSQISYGTSIGQTVQVTWPSWPPCLYMVKTLKIFFSGTKRPITLKVDMQHQVLKYCHLCSNDDPAMTLTYFMARSKLVPCAFVWEKGKTIDFSETIVVYDLKLVTDDRSDKKFLLTSKFCSLGAICLCPWAINRY